MKAPAKKAAKKAAKKPVKVDKVVTMTVNLHKVVRNEEEQEAAMPAFRQLSAIAKALDLEISPIILFQGEVE